jgi:hypothetical protein
VLENLGGPTGFELKTIVTGDAAEQPDVIDISKLMRAGQ